MSAPAERGPVLLAYEGSPQAAAAIARAGELLDGGSAVVVHTWVGLSHYLLRTDPDRLAGPMAEAAEELDAGAEEQAEQVAAEGARLAADAGFQAQPLAVRERRNPWRTLLDCAAAHHASIVVVGARGQSELKAALLGSVSRGLVNHAEDPVLVVPEDIAEDTTGPLLACYDGSDNAKRAIEQAGLLFPGSEAVVLHAWTPWRTRVSYVPGLGGSVAAMAAELDEAGEPQAAELADAGAALAGSAGLNASARSQRADESPWRSIEEAATELAAAAIVLGARGLSGVSAALGSVSHEVLHHARRPVLIVPSAPSESS